MQPPANSARHLHHSAATSSAPISSIGKKTPSLQTPSTSRAVQHLGLAQRHQFIEDGTVDLGLQPRPHRHVGPRLAGLRAEMDADRVLGIGGHQLVQVGAEGQALPRRPSPQSQSFHHSSTATKGASSTSIRPRSTGVSSQKEPSGSRRSTLANRQTSSFRPIRPPSWYQAPLRSMRIWKSPASCFGRGAAPAPGLAAGTAAPRCGPSGGPHTVLHACLPIHRFVCDAPGHRLAYPHVSHTSGRRHVPGASPGTHRRQYRDRVWDD